MSSIKGTRTEQNLLKAFAGESQARSRYTYYAEQAAEEGLNRIAEIFLETAENELEHARVFFSFLEGGMVEINAAYPAGPIGDTTKNLIAAAAGEHEEWHDLYPEFARIADEEGFREVAKAFKMVAKVEKEHEARYLALRDVVEAGKVFEKDAVVRWKCRVCGHIHESTKAPNECPVCKVGREEYEIAAENW